MKIQLLSLAAATALLSLATPASAQVSTNTIVSPTLQKQINTAVKAKSFTDGGDQASFKNSAQSALIAAPTVKMPDNIGKKLAPASNPLAPAVIVNTNVSPLIQLQVNTAVLSKDGVQGGSQVGVNKSAQSGVIVGRGPDNSYIYNTNYSPIYQYQFNNTYGSTNIKQGGPTKAVNISDQNAVVK